MKAAQYSKYGGPEVIEINQNAAQPTLKEGFVLVECYTASLNPVDYVVRGGAYQKILTQTFPVTLAGDFSGVVKEVGSSVTELRVGDRVYGFASVLAGGSGSAAEYVVVSAWMTAHKPAKATFSEAASLPLAGLSALQAIENEIKPMPGQKLLIHGGAGGVGSIAIQYAKHIGCYVATTVRASQRDFVVKLGADKVVDFETEQFEKELTGFDAVLDNVGGEVYRKSFEVVKEGGIIASFVENTPDQELMSKYKVRSPYLRTQVNSKSLSRLSELVGEGIIKAQIDREFPLEKTREAFEYFEGDHPKGKIIIRVR